MTENNKMAYYSPDYVYRWSFRCRWSEGAMVAWVGLNPGTGDTTGKPRPTLKKMVEWSREWGYGGLIIVNLFAWRATDPKDLLKAHNNGSDIIGADNDEAIRTAVEKASLTVACWGNWNRKIGNGERGKDVACILKNPKCLGLTQHGEPRHPLYVKHSKFAEVADLQPLPVPPKILFS